MLDLGTLVAKIRIDASDAVQGANEFKTALGGLQESGAQATKAVQETQQAVSNIGFGIGTFGVLAIGRLISHALGGALESAANFNLEIGRSEGLLNASAEQAVQMRGAVLSLAGETGVGADALGKGLFKAAQAAHDTKEALAITKIAALDARAGFADVGQTVDFLTLATRAWGDTTEASVRRVSDLAFAAQKLGKLPFETQTQTLGKAAVLAAPAGLRPEEFFGLEATLGGVTGTPAQAAAQTQLILDSLLKPNAKLEAAIQEVGGNLIDTGRLNGPNVDRFKQARDLMQSAHADLDRALISGHHADQVPGLRKIFEDRKKAFEEDAKALGPDIIQTLGLAEALKELMATTHGNTAALNEMFFRMSAIPAVMELFRRGLPDLQANIEALGKAAGAAGAAAEGQAGGSAGGAVAFKKLGISIKSYFLGEVGQVLDFLAPVAALVADQFSGNTALKRAYDLQQEALRENPAERARNRSVASRTGGQPLFGNDFAGIKDIENNMARAKNELDQFFDDLLHGRRRRGGGPGGGPGGGGFGVAGDGGGVGGAGAAFVDADNELRRMLAHERDTYNEMTTVSFGAWGEMRSDAANSASVIADNAARGFADANTGAQDGLDRMVVATQHRWDEVQKLLNGGVNADVKFRVENPTIVPVPDQTVGVHWNPDVLAHVPIDVGVNWAQSLLAHDAITVAVNWAQNLLAHDPITVVVNWAQSLLAHDPITVGVHWSPDAVPALPDQTVTVHYVSAGAPPTPAPPPVPSPSTLPDGPAPPKPGLSGGVVDGLPIKIFKPPGILPDEPPIGPPIPDLSSGGGILPFFGGGRVFPNAKGGVFADRTQIGDQVFGEAGPEILLPLDRAHEFGFGKSAGGSGSTVVNLGGVTINIEGAQSDNPRDFAEKVMQHMTHELALVGLRHDT